MCYCVFDDILIYSCTLEEHVEHLRHVSTLLDSDQWHVKSSKCCLARTKISFLGQIISEKGVSMDPSKIEAMVTSPCLQMSIKCEAS